VNGRKLVNSYQEQAELKERQRIERAAAAAAVAEVRLLEDEIILISQNKANK
jgi:hypothetical protein